MKITVHPLFIALGIASAIFGGFPVFIIYALTALMHECGHIFCARRLGYACSKISLMPYGAAALCDTDGISAVDELKLALSGPLVNALICVACAGMWWFYPVSYAYTDTVFSASAVMFLINLLPAYPLDGGRAARCVLKLFLKERVAKIALRAVSGVLAVAFVFVFFFAFKNISFLVFAGFLLCSAFEKEVPLSRISFSAQKPKRGKDIKEVMLSVNSTYRDALRHMDGSKYVIFRFYDKGNLDEITEDEMYELLQNHAIYDKILS